MSVDNANSACWVKTTRRPPGASTSIKSKRWTSIEMKLLDLGDVDRDLATREQPGRDHGAS